MEIRFFYKKKYQNRFVLIAFAVLLLSVSCKSKKTEEPEPEHEATRDELTKDSIYLYAKQVYYWYDALPTQSVFNPRSFTSGKTPLENYEAELFKITQYKINTSTGFPYEYNSSAPDFPKYSYIDDITQQNPVAFVRPQKSSVDLNNNGNDLGISLGLEYSSQFDYKLYVRMVNPNSPA